MDELTAIINNLENLKATKLQEAEEEISALLSEYQERVNQLSSEVVTLKQEASSSQQALENSIKEREVEREQAAAAMRGQDEENRNRFRLLTDQISTLTENNADSVAKLERLRTEMTQKEAEWTETCHVLERLLWDEALAKEELLKQYRMLEEGFFTEEEKWMEMSKDEQEKLNSRLKENGLQEAEEEISALLSEYQERVNQLSSEVVTLKQEASSSQQALENSIKEREVEREQAAAAMRGQDEENRNRFRLLTDQISTLTENNVDSVAKLERLRTEMTQKEAEWTERCHVLERVLWDETLAKEEMLKRCRKVEEGFFTQEEKWMEALNNSTVEIQDFLQRISELDRLASMTDRQKANMKKAEKKVTVAPDAVADFTEKMSWGYVGMNRASFSVALRLCPLLSIRNTSASPLR
ncbi:myosin-6-like [Salarias fasciatus]|uniref:myosin-6-like n=1 Tax=Salarias fasciatus TaxID=181472 RepID=UPI0011770854|nr:myosin-6-like [Salarias fasciatus]